MRFLDLDRLDALDHGQFQATKPYPWVTPFGLLTEEGFRRLHDTLPGVSLFEQRFGEQRKFGQQSHDRYNLEYSPDCGISVDWRAFIGELQGEDYRRFLSRMFGRRSLELRFHWHYTPNGCSVSPHCDTKTKLGSHLFYWNTAEDWDPSWGGQTLILDDGGRFDRRSAADFEEFDRIIESESLDNRSLLFMSKGASWHGVREIRCPEDRLRKALIVVINKAEPARQLLRLFKRPGATA